MENEATGPKAGHNVHQQSNRQVGQSEGTTRAVNAYLAVGWSGVLPLDKGKKSPPPDGHTGAAGSDPTIGQVTAWLDDDRYGNVALRVPDYVIGLDVDAYDGKPGLETIAQFEDEFGYLPDTWSSSSRTDGSKIMFFKVPPGGRYVSGLPGVDMIQRTHRYALVWPSVHPEGRQYAWTAPGEEEPVDDGTVPEVDELPELPIRWVQRLYEGPAETAAGTMATSEQVQEWLQLDNGEADPANEFGRRALDPAAEKVRHGSSRHDALRGATVGLVRDSNAGRYSRNAATLRLRDWFLTVTETKAGGLERTAAEAASEFDSVLAWVIGTFGNDTAAQGQVTAYDLPPHIDTEQEPLPVGLAPNLPAGWYETRPELREIRCFAHARGISADALAGAVLSRVIAGTPPTLTLPAIIGSTASLNVNVAIAGESGASKSSTMNAAADYLPLRPGADIDLDGVPIGSGEGLIEAFFETVAEKDEETANTKHVKRQTRTRALFQVDEGQVIGEQASRSGATLMPTLRSSWSGQTLGQMNASEDRKRLLLKDLYRLVVVMALQPRVAQAILNDADGGTPQRLWRVSAKDPTMLDDPEPEPAPRQWLSRTIKHHSGQGPTATKGETLTVPESVRREIRQRHNKVIRGEVTRPLLDSHRDLNRLKAAAALALIADPNAAGITEEDWQLAGEFMDVSDGVRDWVIATNKAEGQLEQKKKNLRAAGTAITIDNAQAENATRSAARSIARKVHKIEGPVKRSILNQAIGGKYRPHTTLDEVAEHATNEGWIIETPDGWLPGDSQPA